MKLCMIAYGTLVRQNNQWFFDERLSNLVEQLARHCDQIFYLASLQAGTAKLHANDGTSIHKYVVKAHNAQIVGVAASSGHTPAWAKIPILFQRIPTFASYIRRSDFVYITLPGLSGILAHLICRFLRKPYGLYFGSDWQEVARFQSDWTGLSSLLFGPYLWSSKYLERDAVRNAQFVIVHGKKLFTKFQELGVPVVETIPMTLLKLEHFAERSDTCQSTQIRCLYVGSLMERKGIGTLLAACQMLHIKGYKIHLQLVGAGEHAYENQLREQVDRLGLTAYVDFTGYISDLGTLLTYYQQADIFVLPTHGEGFARVIYEAMSQGLPVVTTKIGTLESVLRDHENALLVQPNSENSLAEAIQLLIETPELRQQLITNGYQFARRKLGKGEAAEQVLQLIHRYSLHS